MDSTRPPARPSAHRWLICLELQEIHAAHAEAIDNARRLLLHARRNGWPVVHVHLRPMHGAAGRPIAGCEALPSEPVFFRDGGPTTPDQPFWRLARSAEGSEALLCGIISDPWSSRSADAVARLGIHLTPVREALGGGLSAEVVRKFHAASLRQITSPAQPWLLEAANAP